MVRSDGVKEREGRSPAAATSRAAAVAACAVRPPRSRMLKTLGGVRHPLKHIRLISAARMAAYAKLSGVGEATVVAAFAAPAETESADEGPAHVCGGWESEDGSLKCGYSSRKGRRANMEDFYDIKSSKIDDKQINLFGVFDGHGGTRAAEYLKEHLFNNLLKHPDFNTDTKSATSKTYERTGSDFLEAERNSGREDGSTASTAVFVGNHLYVANVGDSRAVISKAGKAIPLSDDHKPNRSDEQERIESAGGFVNFSGTWRVGGVLAMSRAFGNWFLKKFVVADPEIQEQKIDSEVEFLILASDGLWDVLSNEHAVAFVKDEDGPEAAAQKLTEIAFKRGSTEYNMHCCRILS